MGTAIEHAEIDAVLNANLGRPSVVYSELLDILETNVPGYFAHRGLQSRFVPKSFQLAGEEVAAFPALLVGGQISTEEAGMGFEDNIGAAVTMALAPQVSRMEFLASLTAVEMIRGILYHPSVRGARTRTVYVPGDEGEEPTPVVQTIWYMLIPNGFSVVPQDYRHYSGWSLHLRAGQLTQSNLWVV